LKELSSDDDEIWYRPGFTIRKYDAHLLTLKKYSTISAYYCAGNLRGRLNNFGLNVQDFIDLYENHFPTLYIEQHGKKISELDNYFDEIGFKYEFSTNPTKVHILDDSYKDRLINEHKK
jgi:hypothetical protein